MYKILISKQDVAGSIDYQKLVHGKAATDLENQLNAGNVATVFSVIAHESDHEFVLIAAVEVADPGEIPADKPEEGE